MSVESVYEQAAYCAALTVYLIETKADDADQEIADLLTRHPWLTNIVITVLQAYRK